MDEVRATVAESPRLFVVLPPLVAPVERVNDAVGTRDGRYAVGSNRAANQARTSSKLIVRDAMGTNSAE